MGQRVCFFDFFTKVFWAYVFNDLRLPGFVQARGLDTGARIWFDSWAENDNIEEMQTNFIDGF